MRRRTMIQATLAAGIAGCALSKPSLVAADEAAIVRRALSGAPPVEKTQANF